MKPQLKPSFFNLYYDIDNRKIIYNTLYSTIAEVDSVLFDSLKSAAFCHEDFSSKIKEFLVNKHFVVTEDINEVSVYLDMYEKNKVLRNLDIQLFLATACNLRCNYCYLSSIIDNGYVIKQEAISSFLNWITAEFKTGKFAKCNLEFYGGEPLIAKKFLPILYQELEIISNRFNIPVYFSIVTNGTLFDNELIKLLIRHSTYMQITIDGDRNTHDSRRITSSGSGTFNIILQNIKKIIDFGGNDNLKVRMNIDNENWHEIEKVAGICKSLGVKAFEVGWVHFNSPVSPKYSQNIAEDNYENYMLELYRMLAPFGYAPSIDDFANLTTCMLHRKYGYVINPKLEIYKCDELVDIKQYKVGHIDDNGKLFLNKEEFLNFVRRSPADFDECLQCRCLPVCGSGCAIKALRAHGDLNKSFCETTETKLKKRLENYLAAQEYDF